MNILLNPTKFTGTVQIPSSKSVGHRHLICAALSDGESIVDNISLSEDIIATAQILQALGVEITAVPSAYAERAAYRVRGGLRKQDQPLTVDANESGSTLRFLIPVAIRSGNTVTFHGKGRLASRPLDPYYPIFQEQGISYTLPEEGTLPLTVSGTFRPGHYALPGNVSSQFFTGLLITLPTLDGDSVLESTTPLESVSYVNITLDCLRQHGIHIETVRDGLYKIRGNQRCASGRYDIEGDYSQAAFWLGSGVIGAPVTCTGLHAQSSQGDAAIIDIIRHMGGSITSDGDRLMAAPSSLHGVTIDVEDCPDLVPILTVLASCAQGTTHIINAGRVRLKECDRLHAMAMELNLIGGAITEEPEGLLIHGVPYFTGGTVSGWNDHRVAMALAIASQHCQDPLRIEGAECVRKSYPAFWQDVKAVGGIYTQEG